MTRRRIWTVAVVAFVAGAALAVAVMTVAEDESPPVTTAAASPAVSQVPESRAELVEAWSAELEQAGKQLPEGWEALTTDEIRGRYVHQRMVNAPSAEDIDPGMERRVND